MKRILLTTFLAVGLLSLAAPSFASEPGDIFIGPKAGFTLPSGDFGDQAGNGFAIGATGDYVLQSNMAVGGDIIFNPYGGEDFAGGSYSVSLLHINGHYKYFFGPEAQRGFYGVGNAGFYRASIEFESDENDNPFFDGSFDVSDTEFGIGVGAGFQSTVMEDKTFVAEASYNLVSDLDFLMLSVALLWGVGGGSN